MPCWWLALWVVYAASLCAQGQEVDDAYAYTETWFEDANGTVIEPGTEDGRPGGGKKVKCSKKCCGDLRRVLAPKDKKCKKKQCPCPDEEDDREDDREDDKEEQPQEPVGPTGPGQIIDAQDNDDTQPNGLIGAGAAVGGVLALGGVGILYVQHKRKHRYTERDTRSIDFVLPRGPPPEVPVRHFGNPPRGESSVWGPPRGRSNVWDRN